MTKRKTISPAVKVQIVRKRLVESTITAKATKKDIE